VGCSQTIAVLHRARVIIRITRQAAAAAAAPAVRLQPRYDDKP